MFEKIKHFNFHTFFATTTYGRTLTLMGILLLVVALPVTVTVLQQRTQTQQHAAFILPPGGGGPTNPPPDLCTNHTQQYCVPKTEGCATGDPIGVGSCGVNQTCCIKRVTTCNPKTINPYCFGQQTCTKQILSDCSETITGCKLVQNGICAPLPTPTHTPCAATASGAKISCVPVGTCNAMGGSAEGSCGGGFTCCAAPAPTSAPVACSAQTEDAMPGVHGECTNSAASCADTFKSKTDCTAKGQSCCFRPADEFICDHEGSTKPNENGFHTNSNYPFGPTARFCASDELCISSYRSNQGWPCAKNYALLCKDFTFDDQAEPNGTCESVQPLDAPNCPYPKSYVLSFIGNGVFSCHYTGPTSPVATIASNSCTNQGGSCLVSSSQGASPCGQPLTQYNAACDAVARNSFCCKTSSIPSPPTTGGSGGTGGTGGTGGGAPAGPTCTPGKATQFAANIKLPGIGTGTFENNSPKHPTKHASIVIKDGTGAIIQGSSHDFSHALSHANGNGKLAVARMATPQLVCGKTYHVEIKIPGYVTVKKDIVYGDTAQTLEISESDIIPGDIVGSGTTNTITPDNKIAGDDVVDISDYNVFKTCHENPGSPIQFINNTQTLNLNCPDLINLFDFQDGGVGTDANGISEFADNYNLWLRGFLKFQGK